MGARAATSAFAIAVLVCKAEVIMDSVRSFIRIWAAMTAVILAYAVIDLRMNPWLAGETNFSMTPDFNQMDDLLHWGGRLLKEDAGVLLGCNALVLGGLLALVVHRVLIFVRRSAPRETAMPERISVVPSSGTPSVPPPA
jgi:hypothetical protein